MKQLGLEFDETRAAVARELDSAERVLELLFQWHEAGWLKELDLRFARFLHAEQPDVAPLLILGAALASHQLGRGHVCLDLTAMLQRPNRVLDLPPEVRGDGAAGDAALPVTPAVILTNLTLDDWVRAMHPGVVSDGRRATPLVYEQGRLYLYRYWRYEQVVAEGVSARVRQASEQVGRQDLAASMRAVLDQLFPPVEDASGPDWQRVACALAAKQRFSIITGGPGTGKTTTVVRLLALLQALHFEQAMASAGENGATGRWRPLRIRLAAPTGKAAARLSESIMAKVGALPVERLPGGQQLVDGIPTQVTTLHRLLGGRPHVQSRRFHAGNPLPLDVLVIDEASMVALSDMAAVIAALPPHAQLILIGDKDQLSSVDAGAVLGELCQRANAGHYLPDTASWLEKVTGMALPAALIDESGQPLDQAVAMLRMSYRFGSRSGIGSLAAAVNEGRAEDALVLFTGTMPDLAVLSPSANDDETLMQLLVGGATGSGVGRETSSEGLERRGYGYYLERVSAGPVSESPDDVDAWAAQVLEAQRACQVLCVLRAGPWGVEGLNHAIARALQAQGRIPVAAGWYAGRPVMVTRNNAALRLTNGDMGVVLPYPDGRGGEQLRVAFTDGDSSRVRWFAPHRLDDIETVYALTVHKSQGSEFQHAILVMPPTPSPVLTRELLYTAITRASHWFTLVNPGGEALLKHTIGQRVYRSGGLGERLAAMR